MLSFVMLVVSQLTQMQVKWSTMDSTGMPQTIVTVVTTAANHFLDSHFYQRMERFIVPQSAAVVCLLFTKVMNILFLYNQT